MVNVDKHIAYWLGTAKDSWEDAESLLASKRFTFAAFAAHLALEKALKAHVTRETADIPPRIHDLKSLARLAKLNLASEQLEFLGDFNNYQLEGRYPDHERIVPKPEHIKRDLVKAKELFGWLIQQF